MQYHDFYLLTLTLQVDLLLKQRGLRIVAIYIWLSPASYVVFLTTVIIIYSQTVPKFRYFPKCKKYGHIPKLLDYKLQQLE